MTVASLAFVTGAVNVCGFPKITVALGGVTATAIDPGGFGRGAGFGFGVTSPAPRLAQPCSPLVTRTRSNSDSSPARSEYFLDNFPGSSCGKGRMPVAMQANNQRKRAQQEDANQKLRASLRYRCNVFIVS